jgi:hypothetical protein
VAGEEPGVDRAPGAPGVHVLGEAVENFWRIGKKIMDSNLLGWFAALAVVIGVAMFPLIALLAGIALLAQDLYLFFNNPKADTLTRDLVDGFKKLGKEIEKIGIWETLKEGADKFATWFAEKLVEAIRTATKNHFFDPNEPPRPRPGQQIINAQPPSTEQGMAQRYDRVSQRVRMGRTTRAGSRSAHRRLDQLVRPASPDQFPVSRSRHQHQRQRQCWPGHGRPGNWQ